MSMRAAHSVTISFGLVVFPVKLYVACSSDAVQFNLMTPKGSRVKMQFIDDAGEVVERESCDKAFEYAKNQYVRFTKDEISKLETKSTNSVEISEFVPIASVDLTHVEKSYYLAPDKGANKAFTLLAEVMERTGKAAVAQWAARGKDQLVVIRPYKDGLILHQMFYSSEVRDLSEITQDRAAIQMAEIQMAEQLVQNLSTDRFDATKYKDAYTDRVAKAVEQKVAGQEVQVIQTSAATSSIDLFTALKASLDKGQAAKQAVAMLEKPAMEKKSGVKRNKRESV